MNIWSQLYDFDLAKQIFQLLSGQKYNIFCKIDVLYEIFMQNMSWKKNHKKTKQNKNNKQKKQNKTKQMNPPKSENKYISK